MPGSPQQLTGDSMGSRCAGPERVGQGFQEEVLTVSWCFGGNLVRRRDVNWAMVDDYGVDV